MCGRYTLTRPADLVEELGVEPKGELAPRYNIAPTQNLPVVRATREGGGRELAVMRWGLIPSWAKDEKIGNKLINARSETAAEKPSFRSAMKSRRCLILADGFFEWAKIEGAKQPHYIHLKDHKPFVFAGLWERWSKDPEQGPVDSYTILTTSANEAIRPLHDRMPVILDPASHDLWLDPEVGAGEVKDLLKPYADEAIEYEPVSRLVNNPRNDVPQCVEPLKR
jgi:putative SOS response-associated peptidase YedK